MVRKGEIFQVNQRFEEGRGGGKGGGEGRRGRGERRRGRGEERKMAKMIKEEEKKRGGLTFIVYLLHVWH
jgi:hypothetical protein